MPTVRLTCGNWSGDAYTGYHSGPCPGRGYIDMPAELLLTGEWRDWLLEQDDKGWSITVHHCLDASSHEVNAGSRFHDNKHEMIFCCLPCMVAYGLSLYLAPPSIDVIMAAVRRSAEG